MTSHPYSEEEQKNAMYQQEVEEKLQVADAADEAAGVGASVEDQEGATLTTENQPCLC